MDLGIGDIFNCRVAGNVRNADILGSMEFACKLAGAKVVLVMGHTACGAIKGAIDNAELGNLTGLLAKIKPAVDATTYAGERSAKNYAFVDAVARKNVEMTVVESGRTARCLPNWKRRAASRLLARMYNLETRRRGVLRRNARRSVAHKGSGAHMWPRRLDDWNVALRRDDERSGRSAWLWQGHGSVDVDLARARVGDPVGHTRSRRRWRSSTPRPEPLCSAPSLPRCTMRRWSLTALASRSARLSSPWP